MRTYVVKPGDSPAGIASRPDMAGCPKCVIDLVRANPHKATRTLPNGFVTFKELRVGEILNLPDKWFDGSLDTRPPAYFASLPYADGVTPGVRFDLPGVLGDFAALDVATSKVGALAAMDNRTFNKNVGDVGLSITNAVKEAYGSTNQEAAKIAQDVQNGTQWAWQRNQDLTNAIQMAGDANPTNVGEIRSDIQNALSTALGNARLVLQKYYGSTQPLPAPPAAPQGAGMPAAVVNAARGAVDAIGADANYCSSVARPGSAVNRAVHAFKTAWNATQQSPIPIGTSNYEAETSAALSQALGAAAPAPCAGRPGAGILPMPILPIESPTRRRLTTGEVVGLSLAAAGVVGGTTFLASRRRAGRARARGRRS